MSNVAKTNTSYRMLTVLLLAFSILNISSFMSESLSERSMASEGAEDTSVQALGSCPLRNLNVEPGKMNGNAPEVNCDGTYTSQNKEVSGNVTVRKIKTGNDAQDFEYEVEMSLETECDVCDSSIRSTGVIRPTTKDIGALERFINQRFKKESVTLLNEVKKNKKIAKEIAECRRSEEGEILTTDEQHECLVERISSGELEDKDAAKLYDSRLKPALDAMMTSGDMTQMKSAMSILSSLRSSGANGYVMASAGDMLSYGSMKVKSMNLERQMSFFDPKDPRYQALSQQASMLSQQADRYFTGRVNQVQTQSMFMTDGFEYAQNLIGDLQTWQNDLSSSMATLVQQAGSTTSGQGGSSSGVPTDISGRTSRGQSGGASVPNGGTVIPTGIPQVGAPVNGNSNVRPNGMGQNGIPQFPGQQQGQQMPPFMQQQQQGQQMPPFMQQQQQGQQMPPFMQQQQQGQQMPPFMQQQQQRPPFYSNQPGPGQVGPGGQMMPQGPQMGVPGYQGQMPFGYTGVPRQYM